MTSPMTSQIGQAGDRMTSPMTPSNPPHARRTLYGIGGRAFPPVHLWDAVRHPA